MSTTPMLPVTPMTLGDMFDRLFKLIAKTWARNLALSSIILLVPTMVMIIGMDMFFSAFAGIDELSQTQEQPGLREVAGFVGGWLMIMFAYVILLLGRVAAGLGVTIIGCEEFNGRTLGWQDALAETFSMKLLRAFGQYTLEILLIICAIAIPYGMLIAAIIAESGLVIFLTILLLLGALGVVAYFAVRWVFTFPVIACEDAGVMQSFKRSWNLVDGNWWRVLGIMVLMSMVISFAVSLVMTPIYLFVMWDLFAGYFQQFSSGEADPSTVTEVFANLGLRFGIFIGLSTVLEMLFTPLVAVVLYFDLRSRAGEFSEPSAPTDLASL